MLARVRLLRGSDVICSAGDSLFIDKARSHAGAGFVVGADAVQRMLDPRWCPVLPMLEEFDRLDTRFFVAGRIDSHGEFIDLGHIDVPTGFKHLFVEVPGRWDVSSSALREHHG